VWAPRSWSTFPTAAPKAAFVFPDILANGGAKSGVRLMTWIMGTISMRGHTVSVLITKRRVALVVYGIVVARSIDGARLWNVYNLVRSCGEARSQNRNAMI
jgi:hypothetical protein